MNRGYKVTDARRSRRVGVACSSLQELKMKGSLKLNIHQELKDDIVVQMEDGTIVDDEEYFCSLPANTLFLLLEVGETAITGSEILYNALRAVNLELLQAGELVNEFFTDNLKAKVQQLASLIAPPRDKSSVEELAARRCKSSRSDDPEWFEGLETNANSKEKFLFMRAQERVRGYLYKSSTDLKKSILYMEDKQARKKIDAAMIYFREQLSLYKCFGSYFDRKERDDSSRLCDVSGDFYCGGLWNILSCKYMTHSINPYESREARILFSTWNLDHRIERSRSILPALLEAARRAATKQCCINVEYFFNLLFTTKNLKLVHIVCHDKGAHMVHCDPKQYLQISEGSHTLCEG